jgi:hypothetical protein
MNIITNHHFRPVLQSYELTEKELLEFDYLEGESLEQASFFRYRGNVYQLAEFQAIIHKGQSSNFGFAFYDSTGILKDWDGIQPDSFFSAIVVKYDEHAESVKVGSAFS